MQKREISLKREDNYSQTVILLLIVSFQLTLTFRLLQNLTLILSPKHTQIHFLTHTFTHARARVLTHIFIFLLPLGLINKFIYIDIHTPDHIWTLIQTYTYTYNHNYYLTQIHS